VLRTSVQTGKEEWAGVVSDFIVSTLSWSPDGHLLAAGLETLPPGGFIQIIDVDTGQILDSFYAGYSMPSLAWSPDGSMLAAGLAKYDILPGREGWIRIWDATDFRLITELKHGYTTDVTQIAWSPDGSQLASAGYNEDGFDNSVRTWDTTSWTLLQTFEHPDLVMSVAWSPDGTKLASSGGGVPGRIWDAATGQRLVDLQVDDPEEMLAGASYIAWRPNSSQVVSRMIGKIILWDSATGQVIEERPLVFYSLNLAWSPDGSLLTFGLDDRIASIAPPLLLPITPTPTLDRR
jgi:WD40 repeat protein